MTNEELPFSAELVGRAVSFHMMRKRLSAVDLSFLTGIAKERISEMERGETQMTQLELELISGAVGCPPITLFLP